MKLTNKNVAVPISHVLYAPLALFLVVTCLFVSAGLLVTSALSIVINIVRIPILIGYGFAKLFTS